MSFFVLVAVSFLAYLLISTIADGLLRKYADAPWNDKTLSLLLGLLWPIVATMCALMFVACVLRLLLRAATRGFLFGE